VLTRQEIYKIINGQRKITAEMSLRFGVFFGMSTGYWHRLQNDYDLRLAKQEKLEQFKKSIRPMEAA
jgi:addiction module HigA family antidote